MNSKKTFIALFLLMALSGCSLYSHTNIMLEDSQINTKATYVITPDKDRGSNKRTLTILSFEYEIARAVMASAAFLRYLII